MARRGSDDPFRDAAFLQRLATELARAGRDYVRPFIPSQTLRSSLQVVQGESFNKSSIFIPHYWAVYLHDGRGAFGPRKKRVLVYFRNPANDPRIRGGYPVRAVENRRLTEGEWNYWLRQNRIALALGVPPPMIIKKFVGPQRGSFFFDNSRTMGVFAGRIADTIVQKEAIPFLRESLKEFMVVEVEKVTIRL